MVIHPELKSLHLLCTCPCCTELSDGTMFSSEIWGNGNCLLHLGFGCHVLYVSSSANAAGWFFSRFPWESQNLAKWVIGWIHMERLLLNHIFFFYVLEQSFLCGVAVGGIELEESFCQRRQAAGLFRDNIGSFWIALWLLLVPSYSVT